MKFKTTLLFLALLLGACTPASPTVDPAATATESGGEETLEASPQATADNPASTVLTIWLPPRFDPADGSLAGSMLQARLADFADQHPQVRIEVRVKAESGTGGLLDSLLNAKAAAPLVLPDLVLLPGVQLAAAVEADLVTSLAGLSNETNPDDWYPFAQELVTVDNQVYGLPFAGDALVMAYRPSAVNSVPNNWSALLESRLALGFAAGDPLALFTITQLQAASADRNVPSTELTFSQETLQRVFDFYVDGADRGVFPFWLGQYQSQEQSWQAFSEGRVPMVVAWTSRVFDSRNVDVASAPLPTPDGDYFTLAQGWAWAVSTPNSDQAALSAELAEFLTGPEFLAQWSAAAGLLPPRPSSLAAWSPDARQALASQILDGAMALPSEAELERWGDPLSEAVIAILKQELTAEEAMQMVLEAIANP